MHGLKILLQTSALFFCGCVSHGTKNADAVQESDVRRGIGANQCYERATAFNEIGAHLEAGIYFEAALRYGGDEARILPPLVEAQVRAGQLRAAKKNIARLLVISKNQPEVLELLSLVERLLPQDEQDSLPEETQ